MSHSQSPVESVRQTLSDWCNKEARIKFINQALYPPLLIENNVLICAVDYSGIIVKKGESPEFFIPFNNIAYVKLV